MQRFVTTREAKEFLIGKIVQQAQRGGTALSDVERKMLYYSETGWTLPDIGEVNEVFEREYGQAQYESKIATIIRQLRSRKYRDAGEFDAWNNALERLRDGDHYLLVMIDQAGAAGRRRGDLVKLIVTALVISSVLLAIVISSANR